MSGLEIRSELEQMEYRREALNEQLMRVREREEANAIEREILALRMKIAHYRHLLESVPDSAIERDPFATSTAEHENHAGPRGRGSSTSA